MCIIFNY